jgi:putative endonuclease
MGKQENKIVGNRGETLAVEHLQMKGYKILGRNYASKWGEIDIVAKDKDIVVFVEVKTKSTLPLYFLNSSLLATSSLPLQM